MISVRTTLTAIPWSFKLFYMQKKNQAYACTEWSKKNIKCLCIAILDNNLGKMDLNN